MQATFMIPGKLPGLNDLLKKAYASRFSANDLKKKTQKMIGQYIIAGRLPWFDKPVIISFDWVEPDRRRDIDNVAAGGRKYILDSLVECGVLKNDSRQYVRGFVDHFPEPNKKNPHITVTIETLAEPLNEPSEG